MTDTGLFTRIAHNDGVKLSAVLEQAENERFPCRAPAEFCLALVLAFPLVFAARIACIPRGRTFEQGIGCARPMAAGGLANCAVDKGLVGLV